MSADRRSITVALEPADGRLAKELAQEEAAEQAIAVVVYPSPPRTTFGSPDLVELAISFGAGVSSSVVANWLYEKIVGRASRLRIERVDVEIDQGEIRRIIQEHIEDQG